MPYEYNGKIPQVDLSSATLRQEEPAEEFYRKYIDPFRQWRHRCADTGNTGTIGSRMDITSR